MTTNDIAKLIYEIVGATKISKSQKRMIATVIGLVTLQQAQSTPANKPSVSTVQTVEPNTYKEDTGEKDLDEMTTFVMPNEINLQFEGQEEARKVILKPTPTIQ